MKPQVFLLPPNNYKEQWNKMTIDPLKMYSPPNVSQQVINNYLEDLNQNNWEGTKRESSTYKLWLSSPTHH